MKTRSQNKTGRGLSSNLGYLRVWLALVTTCVVLTAPTSAANFVRWQNASDGLDLGTGAGVVEVTMGADAVVAYAIVDETGLYRSTDGGTKWDRLRGSAPPLRAPYAVQADPRDGRIVWAGCREDGQGLWQSNDQGQTWRKVGDKQSGMASDDVEWITVHPAFPNLILVGHRSGPAMSVSTNAGKNWSASNLGAEVKRQLPFIISETRWVVASREHGGIRVTDDGGKTWTAAGDNTDYFPGPLPVIRAGEYLFSSKHHGTNKSTDGGKTWAYRMERHARVIGTMGDLLFREDRADIRGEDARRLTIHLSDDYANSWEDVTGGLLDVVPERWQSHLVIQNQVDPYAHVRMATAWCAAPEKRMVLLALGKAGLYRGTLMQTKGGPLIVNPRVTPLTVLEGDTETTLVVQAMIATRRGKLARAFVDLGAVGGGELNLFDDGEHEDGQVGDRLFGNSFRLSKKLPPGVKNLGIIAEDDAGRVSGVAATLKIASPEDRIIVWDGDQFAQGHAWIGPAEGFNFFKSQSDEAHGGKVAMEFHADVTGGWVGGGWNWHGWYLALDNEPFLWHSTHRGMHPAGCSYDELWDRTRTYASLLKKIDPDVKIAGGNLWGWTAYFYSGLDSQLVGQGQGSWDSPPDFAQHNQEPVARWLLKKLKQHEEETGIRLVDIFDFHFYPQTGIYMAGQPNDPQVMEGRVQETRVMWDPSWKDPSWMGKETGKVIQLIRLMKKWVDECNPGLQLAIGEYNFGGEKDVSGGVAQAELLGVFAREKLDHAYYWFFPAVNSSPYFAFKMFRNPDGAHTPFGDVYLPSQVSAPDDVSVHAARDTRTGRLTFIFVNKRAARGARVDLRLSQPLPSQSLRVYEYGLADKHGIGQWPDRPVQGNRLQIDLPPMTVLRFDLQPTSN